MTDVEQVPRPAWRVFFTTWVLLAALATGWALASPVGGAPDEPAHLIKAASVVRGEFVGTGSTAGNVVDVPRYVGYTQLQLCYVFHPQRTADCIPDVVGDPAETVVAATTAGLYNPVYYALIGWPSLLLDDTNGLFAMRIVSAIVSTAMLALAFSLVALWRRPATASLVLATTVTPMVLFLCGSVNPNALEITATLALVVAVLSMTRYPSTALLANRSASAAVAGVLAVTSRGLSPLWVMVAIAIPVLAASRAQLAELVRARAVRVSAAVLGAATLFALGWLAFSNSLGAALTPANGESTVPFAGASPVTGFLLVLQQSVPQLESMIAVFGWLDTPAPPAVMYVWMALLAGVTVTALCLARGRDAVLLGSALATTALLPALVQAAYITGGGYIWQGRYTLPLVAVLIASAAAVVADRAGPDRVTGRLRLAVVVVVAMTATQWVSFAAALHRYAVGLDTGWGSMLTSARWQPPGGILTALVVYACLCALTGGVALRAWVIRRRTAVSDEVRLAVGEAATAPDRP